MMTKLVALSAIATMALTMAGNSGNALSSAPERISAESDVAGNGIEVSYNDVQKAREYWTPERMDSAKPMDMPEIDVSEQSERDGRNTFRNSDLPPLVEILSEPVGSLPWDDPWIEEQDILLPEDASKTNGKLFATYYDEDGKPQDGVCSASAVNSSSKRVIVTAGHCVHSGGKTGSYYDFLMFAPAYAEGPSGNGYWPLHSYPVAERHVAQTWLDNGSGKEGWMRDVAFLATDSNPLGQRVVDRAGGHGLKIGGNQFQAHVMGYPGPPFDGFTQAICAGQTYDQFFPFSYNYLALGDCPLTEGASGSPFLEGYDPETGLGYVRSVDSHIDPGYSEDTVYGPYFNGEVYELYEAANSWTGWVFP